MSTRTAADLIVDHLIAALERHPDVEAMRDIAEEDPVDVADIYAATSARDHQVFSGKIDKSKLSFGEKAILIAVRAAEGDFRDWAEIESWATDIADQLVKETSAK